MFIKSVIIDGFKSYGTRTEIKGFDSEFNAITGLNGTGKSNILDSICFVLGISNLTHVRANSLQDLIYKSGQAGVTKASVTIVFDNSDTSKSPINYEQHDEITVTRQIVVAGKNRYMINGSTVTNKHVTDFFNSIQLNVNNPHFLIMQGRITKVLNMKPPEILSMIEEAAGTRMYENKKIGAQKTIEKKDSKLKEMDEMINESINPKLQKLKEEKSQYVEYQRIQRELEQLNRIYTAYQYLNKEKWKQQSEEQLKGHILQLEGAKTAIAEGHEQIATLEKQIEELQARRDAESGGNLHELETQLKEISTAEAKSSAALKGEKENLAAETKRQKQLDKNVKDDEKALSTKKAELSNAQNVFDALQDAEKNDAEALTAAQERFQAVSSGLVATDEGDNATLQDQLISAKEQLTEAETEVTQCNMNIKHNKSELERKRPLLKKTELAFAKDQKDLNLKEKELESLQTALGRLNYEDGLAERLQQQLRNLSEQTRTSSAELNNLSHRYPFLMFEYDDPEPNFDRRKVRGLLCKLFKVQDSKFNRAVETVAGGKMYNVVVDDEGISAKLIKKGNLRRRTTFAPLNKIQGSRADNRMIQKAEQIAGRGNVFLALSLVEYEPRYESVMSWTFGQTFICTSTESAKKVAFHPEIKRKCIDLDGNVFDPSGIISGGAVDKSQPILSALVNISEAETRVSTLKAEYGQINQQLNELSPIAASYESMKQKFDLCSRELERVKARLQDTPHYQLQQELEELDANIKAKEERIGHCKNVIKEKTAKVKELESKMKNMKAVREKAVADAEAALKKAKKKAEDSRTKWKQREQEFAALSLEIQELEKSTESGKEQLVTSSETITRLQESIDSLSQELAKIQEEVKAKKSLVKAQKDAIGQKDKEIQQMTTEKEKAAKRINDEELNLKSLANYIDGCKKDVEKNDLMLKKMRKEYRWIEGDREYFGQANGMYDFEANNPEEAGRKIDKLNKLKEKIGRNVNPKAMDMLSTQEEQFEEVMNKKGIIEEDRSKILFVIEELDVKKEEVIKKAWEKVNNDFNSILSSLLPSAHAKLKPVDGKSFMDGLEVKVGFGGIWKESLDELSGGQRSLVALSLILAMLLFKPAPLYILDEVDAALDPSHTQNIGQMLKAHFRQSQFIVVSLKDGMFNNANVLFRTSFIDGMSAVTRTVGGGRG
ncbi:hypothetical protein GE061_017109 [Apolygus lucorum]|uniref:Structural maintenance of chromosomes protein n=1 Tax=Apolygus lucorum TaxID=248454 RepID=A0A8S9XK47_APOLU|nr:hypothetical protein GE061_017109 [Apolygus lucorum]